MGRKKETSLQERIQKLIMKNGGYVVKNHGSMISEPGIADLTVCYRGRYIAIEVKVDNNTTSEHQMIHARKVKAAGGYFLVAYNLEDVEKFLVYIDAVIDKYDMYSKKLMQEIIDCGGTEYDD